jgi:hypothetical protein
MPSRDEQYFKHERAEFDADMSAARAALAAGQFAAATELVVSPAHKYWYGKEPVRFKLLSDLYKLIESRFEGAHYREGSWQAKLLAELYSVWPKVELAAANLRHSFPEPPSDAYVVSGAESVQLARYGWTDTPVALSRGRFWLKLWKVETGEVIHAREEPLRLLASFIGRDSSHVLFAQPFSTEDGRPCWSVSFRETMRQISGRRGGTYEKSHYANVRYYKVRGEIVSLQRERTVEVDRAAFKANPIKGTVIPPHKVSAEYLAMLDEEHREEILRDREIVRVKQPQTLTLAHEEIEGYLPAQTTTFEAVDGMSGPTVSDLARGMHITAYVAVEDDEAWLEGIIVPGHGLNGMYSRLPTTPINSLCLSSDGSLGVRNGGGETFSIWNMWTGEPLRDFKGHTDRVTCICLSVDVSFAVSGSEDQTVRVWTPVSAECVRVLAGHESAITAVCISLDATRVLSADHDGVIKLWDRATGECLRTIKADSHHISGLHLTVDGRFAASSSWDKTVKLWNLADGSCMKTLEHSDWVTSIDITPDGRYLVASSYEGTRVWELVWRLEPRDVAEWDEGARPYLEILMNANAAWDGKLSTPVDMTEEEIRNTLRRQGPSWIAWHAPSKKEDWYRVWHLNWDIDETLGHAGYGWLSEAGREGTKIIEEWQGRHQNPG